jgi:hypothetical protein
MARRNQFRKSDTGRILGYVYEAELVRCHARAALDRAADGVDDKDRSGLLARLTRGPDGPIR